MSGIRVIAFAGERPRSASYLIAENEAIAAENVKLSSGALLPVRSPLKVYTPNKPMPSRTLFRAKYAGASAWMTWPIDVNAVRVPLPEDVEARYCWTGDVVPRVALHSEAISGGADNYPAVSYALGIPAPQDKPVVTPSGGVGSTVTRFYLETFMSQWGEESAPGPVSLSAAGKVDGSWNVTNLGGLPANSGALTAVYSIATNRTTLTCGAYHWLRQDEPITLGGRAATVAKLVDGKIFQVVGDYSAETTWTRAVPWRSSGIKRRLYRTAGASASWQLVADDVGESYTDILSDAQILGDELISEKWNPPPAKLQGLCVHPSGALLGFVGNQVFVSEELQPHAWDDGRFSTAAPIVGIGVFGTVAVVCTEGEPYTLSGTDSASLSLDRLSGTPACLSKRGIVSTNDGVLYASKDGMIFAGQGGVRNFTQDYFTRREWLPLMPETMCCAHANGTVLIAYSAATGEAGIKVLSEGHLTRLSGRVHALYVDPDTGETYTAMDDGVYQLDPAEGTYPLRAAWRSKDFRFPVPLNLGAARIKFAQAISPSVKAALEAERADLTAKNAVLLSGAGFQGGYGCSGYGMRVICGSRANNIPPLPPSNDVQFVLRVGDEVVIQRVVTDEAAFRLPSGEKYDTASVEVSGQGEIREIHLAETMDGLRVI